MRKGAVMSSTPAVVISAAISVPLQSFSESSRSVLRSPSTTSAVPLGLSLSAATARSIVKVSSGAR